LIVVTGHYDHLGMRGDDIFNGADDNGSGTSTVLDIAEAFAAARDQGQGPRRSILFMLVTGEEKGLLGSRYYVEHPVFPLEQTVANVNVDMIGRVDEAHADNPNYVYVIGADRLSTELHEINEAANARYTELELDYTFNAEDDPNQYYYRSDHYNFAERGIPAIFYFSGVHEDYHRPGDTADKIMYDKTATIGRLIFHTISELANRDERIVVDVVDEGE
jgi:Zn-dependent M28 family amino/carboxypeptidase